MNDVLFLFLSLSVSGSIIALILLALKSLIKDRLSQTWQYYIWLIVILRFLLPFTPEVSIVGEAARHIENRILNVTALDVLPTANIMSPTFGNVPDIGQQDLYTQYRPIPGITQNNMVQENIAHEDILQPTANITRNYLAIVLSYAWLLWLVVALALLSYKITSYRNFVRFVKGRAQKVTNTHVLDIYKVELAAANIKRKLPLRVNDWVSSPMLVGIFRPTLVLPTVKVSDNELKHTFQHELIHHKRFDFAYKWIVQITKCLHWFNPLMYVICKQIDKSCELSCDEMVIRNLDESGRGSYGDALVASLKSQSNYSGFMVSMTMSEDVKIIKERLDMIMKFKKKSKFAVVCAVLLAVALSVGAGVTGTYVLD